MTNPIVKEINVVTGEVVERTMTAEELAEYESKQEN